MPRLFVGLHAALLIVITLAGLSFLLDPCGGGGDLCLGGVVGLTILGVALAGAVGIVIWLAAQRASPLLVLDCMILTVAVYLLLSADPYGPQTTLLVGQLLAVLALPSAALAGARVATHRIESVGAAVVLVGIGAFAGGGVGVPAFGLLALGAGWLWARSRAADRAGGGGPGAPQASPGPGVDVSGATDEPVLH